LNNRISAHFFEMLEKQGIPTHFEKLLSDREMLVKAVEIIPVEVIVRNIAAGSLAKRLGLEEGTPMKRPVLEFCYKSDELGDPMINHYHIYALGLASEEEMKVIEDIALKVNSILVEYLKPRNIELVDFKLEFGRYKGRVILADEISPDTCRFWDADTREKLDKDRFRRDLGNVEEAYREVLKRLTGGN
jgi:phosphoribosylaminoimidazole-succinocarboxamide synthase